MALRVFMFCLYGADKKSFFLLSELKARIRPNADKGMVSVPSYLLIRKFVAWYNYLLWVRIGFVLPVILVSR